MANKRLPRRTMSMAKKASATAEAASDLDLVEGVVGEEKPTTYGQLLLGWAMAVATIIIVIVAVKVLFTGGVDNNFSMLPDGYRESTGLPTEDEAQAAQQQGTEAATGDAIVGVDRSPFPVPRTIEPIIVDVDCPAGTVQIRTGPRPADTVCVQGQLVEPLPTEGQAQRIIIVTGDGDTSTVGGTDVPDSLHCTEDEGIAFDGEPNTLVCVAVDDGSTPTPAP